MNPEQTPVRCRGTRSHYSVDTIREKPKLQETEKNLRKFMEPSQKPKVLFTWTIYRNLVNIEKNNHGIIGQAFSHRLETSEIAERAVRRVKEGTSAVLLQSGLEEKWWSDSMKYYYYLQNVQNPLTDGKSQYDLRSGESFKGRIVLFDALIGYLPKLREKQSINSSIRKKFATRIFFWLCFFRG